MLNAAWHGHVAELARLAGAGASVTQPDNYGRTPLYKTACCGHLEAVRWLAANGGSVTQPDEYGFTPLYVAALNGHLEVVQWLAANGAPFTQPNYCGETPLHAAALSGHLEVVQWLAGHGASANRRARDVAKRWGHQEVAQWLDWAEDKSTVAVLVACRRVDDVKSGLKAGALALGNRVNLIAISEHDTLWEGAPAVCPTMVRLVRDAVAPWSPERHFLAPPSVRKEIHTMLLVARREPSSDAPIALPQELWHTIFGFLV